MTGKRPDGTSMEGMIWNANNVLDTAMDPKTPGVPRTLFQDCKGIALISVVEAGFIFSGSVGTGIIMAKGKDGKWSAPSAVGLTGVGWGLLVGGAIKNVMIFMMDQPTMSAYSGDVQIKLGGKGNITIGPWGRDANISLDVSNTGIGGSVAVAFSRGIFGGLTIEGAALAQRNGANEAFYGKTVSPQQILFEGAVEYDDTSMIPELHEKLEALARGDTGEPTKEKKEKAEIALSTSVKEAEDKAKAENDDVVFVDSAKEAEKESAET